MPDSADDPTRFDQRGQNVYGPQINVAGDLNYQAPTPAQALHQLPAPPSDFTGRTDELNDLLAHAQQGTAISGLRGLGGVGKTALALKLAETLKARYPDAQFFIDLQGTREPPLAPTDAMQHVIRAYYPEAKLPESEPELRGLYLSVLNDKRALLLLDNARDAAQVTPLLPPSSCYLLVTSRWHFPLPGLYARDLSELPPDDAVRLLLTIAPRIGEQAGDLARLCGRLPLALRVAASALAQRASLSVPDYIARLKDVRREREPSEVDASLALSYDLLDAMLKTRLAKLAVFPAPFDRPAAAAVWGMQPDDDVAQDGLDSLAHFSLVEWDADAKRYRLHDLVRAFADARLGNDERAGAALRHAQHFKDVVALADDLYQEGGEPMLQGLALFDREWAHIQVSQAWAAKQAEQNDGAARLCDDFAGRGAYCLALRLHPHSRIQWLNVALISARRLELQSAAVAHLSGLGNAYAELGEARQAIEYHTQGLQLAQEIGDRYGEGVALGNLGNDNLALGNAHRAIESFAQRLQIARAIHDRRGEGNGLRNLGNAYAGLGEFRQALEAFEQGLQIAREIGDRRGESNALGNLGNTYAVLGETRQAIDFHDQSLQIAREIGDKRGESNALGNLSNAFAALGNIHQAFELLKQHLSILRETGDRHGESSALGNLGNRYAELGELRRAIEFYEQQLTIVREIGHRRGEATALGNLGVAYNNLGEPRRAIGFHKEALQIALEIGDRRGEGITRGNLGNVHAALGKPREAIDFYQQSLAISREIGDRHGETNGLNNLGTQFRALGEPGQAIALHQQALQIASDIGSRRGEGNALGNLGNAYMDMGEPEQATKLCTQQVVIYCEIGDQKGEARASWNLGLIYERMGELARAVVAMQVLVDYEASIGHPNADQDGAYVNALRHKLTSEAI